MARTVSKVVKDMQAYLSEIGTMAESLPAKQTEQLVEILASVLTLLVCLRQASHLGEIESPFTSEDFEL